jgi:SAM-dependent methyltransferase
MVNPAGDNANDPVEFYSQSATDFHASYKIDANRMERVRIWNEFVERYSENVTFAYDIGCGSGVLSCEIASRGIEVIGIDGAEGMLAISKQSAESKKLTNISFQQHRLPIADTTGFRKADLVISSSVIEYLNSIPEALKFIGNLLRPNGAVIFSVSNRDSISRKLVRLVHNLTGRPKYFGLLRHFMTIEDIKRDLEIAGLTYVEHEYFQRADKLNSLLSMFLEPKYSSNMIIVVAKKR